MKKSIIQALILFGAGAGCATVVAGMFPPAQPISVEGWRAGADKALIDLVTLGFNINSVNYQGVVINLIACTPQPRPKLPAGAVDPQLLRFALEAMYNYNEMKLVGDLEPVTTTDKCKPVNGAYKY